LVLIQLAVRVPAQTVRAPLIRAAPGAPVPDLLLNRHAFRRRLAVDDVAGGASATILASLRGDLRLGYFSTIVGIGTPPQYFELIVDTGSTITAVPCAGCTQCGSHHKFDADRSSTAKRCVGGAECSYFIRYQEGSSYQGRYVTDRFTIGSAHACSALPYRFGCSASEAGLFRSQIADGILGIAPTRQPRRTLQDALVAQRSIREDVFSLCIAPAHDRGHGFIEFGPRPAPPTSAAPVSSPLVGGTGASYLLNVSATRLEWPARDGRPRPLPPLQLGRPTSALLDSGTTFVYAGAKLFAPLLKATRATALGGCELQRAQAPRSDEYCVSPLDAPSGSLWERAPMATRLDHCFAALDFQMSVGSLRSPPSRYFYSNRRGELDSWCMGVFLNGNEQLVLGASVLQDTLVTVDRKRQRVDFAPYRCADADAVGAATDAERRARNESATCQRLPERLPHLRPLEPQRSNRSTPARPAARPTGAPSSAWSPWTTVLGFGGREPSGRTPVAWLVYGLITFVCACGVLFGTCVVCLSKQAADDDSLGSTQEEREELVDEDADAGSATSDVDTDDD
jgi:hypothetical protein